MPNQPDHEPAGQLQVPDSPETQAAKLEYERDVLLEKINLMTEDHRAVLTELREQTHGFSAVNLIAVATDLFREMTALMRQQREMDAELHQLRNHSFTHEREQLVLPETPPPRQKSAEQPRPHRPQIKAWRTWPGFRDNMRARERTAREARRKSGVKAPLQLVDLAEQSGGGDSLKTIERTMHDYGLDPATAGLPSQWPDEDPRQKKSDGHPLAAMIAVIAIIPMLDAVIGGRFDSIVHISHLIGCYGF